VEVEVEVRRRKKKSRVSRVSMSYQTGGPLEERHEEVYLQHGGEQGSDKGGMTKYILKPNT
jgi:hypothetical protein